MTLNKVTNYLKWIYGLILRTNYLDLFQDLFIFFLIFGCFRLAAWGVRMFLGKLKYPWVHTILKPPMGDIFPFARAVALYLLCKELDFVYWLDLPISFGLGFMIFFRGCSLAVSLLVDIVSRFVRRRYPSAEDDLLGPITMIIKIVVWSIGGILALDNLKVNITALVTGLGVGGLAVAFASQKVLGDIFNFFVLTLDAPFRIGDTVRAGNKIGTVEYIGIKTTHIRSADGELLVMPNSELTSSCLQNFKRMSRRRALIDFVISPETDFNKLKKLQEFCEKSLSELESVKFDYAFITGLKGAGWNFRIAFYVLSKDYNVFLEINHLVFLQLLEFFEKEEIFLRFV
ncbi:mechanosensitive ion channel family protein [Candidatus Similichlamydia epinepheli]|uniref:mechanosensitive ion channel family protein n=1 Tax=Candidatus Similichlamydia epinepheli TaxID=1903953 RepID=UPI001300A100|nr:mechanosensitive ion channel family protein [Candidatus Similichlamydia epinepheli]